MIAIAFLFVRSLCDCFKSRRRLDAELLVLRHQLNVLRERAPCRLYLRWADRALFVWLYRRCPHILDVITIVRPADSEPDEDREPVTTMVVDWHSTQLAGVQPGRDAWRQCRRQDQQTVVLRLKRELEAALANAGIELPIPPDGPAVRMDDQEIVREQFYLHTPADGTTERKGEFRRKRFNRALDWAEDQQLIAIHEICDVTYLRLSRPNPGEERDEEGRRDG